MFSSPWESWKILRTYCADFICPALPTSDLFIMFNFALEANPIPQYTPSSSFLPSFHHCLCINSVFLPFITVSVSTLSSCFSSLSLYQLCLPAFHHCLCINSVFLPIITVSVSAFYRLIYSLSSSFLSLSWIL